MQSQAQETRVAIDRVVGLEVEFQEMVAWGEEMFIQGQDYVKNELIRQFPTEEFSWTDDIFLDEEDGTRMGRIKRGQSKAIPLIQLLM